jgi:hypothetical protein
MGIAYRFGGNIIRKVKCPIEIVVPRKLERTVKEEASAVAAR